MFWTIIRILLYFVVAIVHAQFIFEVWTLDVGLGFKLLVSLWLGLGLGLALATMIGAATNLLGVRVD